MARIRMLMQKVAHPFENIEGATMIEYGLIAGLVSVVSIAILTTLGGTLTALWTAINAALTKAI